MTALGLRGSTIHSFFDGPKEHKTAILRRTAYLLHLHLSKIADGHLGRGSAGLVKTGKNFLTFCRIGRVRSRVRPVGAAGMAAGPNALRGSGPKQNGALRKWCVDPSGFSRSPERPYLHYVVMPSPIGVANLVAGLPQAASDNLGSLYLSLRTMMAQAILAILLASATAATFVGRRSINRPSHGRFPVPCLRA